MFCGKCGSIISDSDKFCAVCGTEMKSEEKNSAGKIGLEKLNLNITAFSGDGINKIDSPNSLRKTGIVALIIQGLVVLLSLLPGVFNEEYRIVDDMTYTGLSYCEYDNGERKVNLFSKAFFLNGDFVTVLLIALFIICAIFFICFICNKKGLSLRVSVIPIVISLAQLILYCIIAFTELDYHWETDYDSSESNYNYSLDFLGYVVFFVILALIAMTIYCAYKAWKEKNTQQ